jgi:hypothetical protein
VADQQGSTESSDQGSPFSRPPFVIAAVLILVIVVLGVVVAIRVAGSERTPHVAPTPAASASSTPSTASSPASDARASICGLRGPTGSEPSVQVPPPPAAWEYEGTTAYPTSPEFGPGEKADAGYRFCFQRSVPGAVFAAANALAPPTDAVAGQAWIEYFVSTGTNHDRLLNDMQNDQASDPTGVRIKVIGFKVLSYDGSTARVDIAVEASGSGQTVTGSYVYELTWQDGDWKLNSDAPTPFNFSTVPSAAGYVPWSA